MTGMPDIGLEQPATVAGNVLVMASLGALVACRKADAAAVVGALAGALAGLWVALGADAVRWPGLDLDVTSLAPGFGATEWFWCGMGVTIVALVVGGLVQRASPVAALVLYCLTVVTCAQSRFFEAYPFRLVAPLLMFGLSSWSKHVRHLNICIASFATVELYTSAEAFDEPKSAVFKIVWIGFAILLVQDVIVRMGAVEALVTLLRPGLACFAIVGIIFKLLHIKALAFLFEPTFLWHDLLHQVDCLPRCAPARSRGLLGAFVVGLCAIVFARDILDGKLSWGSGLVLPLVTMGGLIVASLATGNGHFFETPYHCGVAAVCVLLLTELACSKPSKVARRVDYHVLSYWKSNHLNNGKMNTSKSKAIIKAGSQDLKIPTDVSVALKVQKLKTEVAASQEKLAQQRHTLREVAQAATQLEIICGLKAYDKTSENRLSAAKASFQRKKTEKQTIYASVRNLESTIKSQKEELLALQKLRTDF